MNTSEKSKNNKKKTSSKCKQTKTIKHNLSANKQKTIKHPLSALIPSFLSTDVKTSMQIYMTILN